MTFSILIRPILPSSAGGPVPPEAGVGPPVAVAPPSAVLVATDQEERPGRWAQCAPLSWPHPVCHVEHPERA